MKAPVIETKRLLIREFVPEDLEDLYRIYGESESAFLEQLSPNRQEEMEKLKSYIHYIYGFYGFGLWAVCLKETGRLIGRCGLQVIFLPEAQEGEYELGYMISGLYQNQGYGREAVEGVLLYAHEELEAPRVILRIDKGNSRSIDFARTIGFKKMSSKAFKPTGYQVYIYDL